MPVEDSTSLGNWASPALAFVTNFSLGGGAYRYLFLTTNTLSATNLGFIRLRVEPTP